MKKFSKFFIYALVAIIILAIISISKNSKLSNEHTSFLNESSITKKITEESSTEKNITNSTSKESNTLADESINENTTNPYLTVLTLKPDVLLGLSIKGAEIKEIKIKEYVFPANLEYVMADHSFLVIYLEGNSEDLEISLSNGFYMNIDTSYFYLDQRRFYDTKELYSIENGDIVIKNLSKDLSSLYIENLSTAPIYHIEGYADVSCIFFDFWNTSTNN
jgi:hypothetical protein